MRIVTWNINGLRAVCKRGIGDIATLLDSVQADIICFQETKLTKAELDRDLALVEGWDSYFSHCKDRSYSGVATYCRQAVTVPVAAEQGITGILHDSKLEAANAARLIPGCFEQLCNRFTQEELLAIDLEGRCVITDHETFILFNLYGPAITSEENAADRFAYKLRLYEALQCRMEACLAAGRAVILVGDLNICPQPIDSCDPGDPSKFRDRADKQWLSAVMTHNGGFFVDLFRHFYPSREEVYSCWSTASGARVNNYGARIDLILLAEPANPAISQTDAAHEAVKSDVSSNVASHVMDAVRQPQLTRTAGASATNRSLLEQCTNCDVWMDMQGSDHAPVFADWDLVTPLPTPEMAPPLSTRYMFTGKQRKLTAWLGGASTDTQSQPQLSSAPSKLSSQPSIHDTTHHSTLPSPSNSNTVSSSTAEQSSLPVPQYSTVNAAVSTLPKAFSSFTRKGSSSKAGTKGSKSGQTNLRAFLQHPPAASNCATAAVSATSAEGTAAPMAPIHAASAPIAAHADDPVSAPKSSLVDSAKPIVDLHSKTHHQPGLTELLPAAPADMQGSSALAQDALTNALQGSSSDQGGATHAGLGSVHSCETDIIGSQSSGAADADKAAVTAAWSKIHSKMKAPKCKGHGEDCVIREVKKNGPNKGRLFYVCRRADGKPPQGRCDHFEWVGNRTTRGQSTQPAAAVTQSNKRLRKA